MPMHNFLKMLNKEDHKYMYRLKRYSRWIQGKNDESENAWENIWNAYLNKTGDLSYETFVDQYKEFCELKIVHENFTSMIMVLRYRIKPDYIKDLAGRGIKIDTSSHEAYTKTIYAASKKVNQIRTQYKIIEANLLEKIGSNVKTDWDDMVDIIESQRGYVINSKETTVKKFAITVRNIQKQQRNGKRENRS